MARTLLYLVRHGEQDRSSAHAVEGALSELGREQSRLLGQRLRGVPFSGIHHSPLPRAAQTARIVADHLPGVAVHASDLLRDCTPIPSPAHQVPERWAGFLDAVPTDERDEGAVRVQAAVAHFSSVGAQDRTELLITHNFVIGWFVRHVLDAPFWRWIGLNQFNCAITIVQWQVDREPTLITFNDLGHLPVHLRGQAPLELWS